MITYPVLTAVSISLTFTLKHIPGSRRLKRGVLMALAIAQINALLALPAMGLVSWSGWFTWLWLFLFLGLLCVLWFAVMDSLAPIVTLGLWMGAIAAAVWTGSLFGWVSGLQQIAIMGLAIALGASCVHCVVMRTISRAQT